MRDNFLFPAYVISADADDETLVTVSEMIKSGIEDENARHYEQGKDAINDLIEMLDATRKRVISMADSYDYHREDILDGYLRETLYKEAIRISTDLLQAECRFASAMRAAAGAYRIGKCIGEAAYTYPYPWSADLLHVGDWLEIKMPLPIKPYQAQQGMDHTVDELETLLRQCNCSSVELPIEIELHYVYPIDTVGRDLDNYWIKPVIDTIVYAMGTTDSPQCLRKITHFADWEDITVPYLRVVVRHFEPEIAK